MPLAGHCEERSDEAISIRLARGKLRNLNDSEKGDCHARNGLAMTGMLC
jgi:hypothetical protein